MRRNLIRYVEPEEFDELIADSPDIEQFQSGKWRKARLSDSHEVRTRL